MGDRKQPTARLIAVTDRGDGTIDVDLGQEAIRCETCRWWDGERGVTDPERLAVSGECRRHLDGDAPEPFWTEPPLAEDSERKWSRIYTVRDHRCGQWEGKGDE